MNNTIEKIRENKRFYPKMMNNFEEWISSYWSLERNLKNQNQVIINLEDEIEFKKALIYYISGMTDNFAIDTYREIIGF